MGNNNDICNCARKHTEKEICYTKRNRALSCDNMIIDNKKIHLVKVENKNIIDTILNESDTIINENTIEHKICSVKNKKEKVINKNELNSRNNIGLAYDIRNNTSKANTKTKSKSKYSNKSKNSSYRNDPLIYPPLIGLSSLLEKKINGLIIQTATTRNQIIN
jgi:hypothetical protein